MDGEGVFIAGLGEGERVDGNVVGGCVVASPCSWYGTELR